MVKLNSMVNPEPVKNRSSDGHLIAFGGNMLKLTHR